MMSRFLVLITAFLVTLGGATFAGVHIISAVERQSTTTTYSMKVGSLTRQYEVISPTADAAEVGPDHRRAVRARPPPPATRSPGTR